MTLTASATSKNGCFNRVMKDTLEVKNGYEIIRIPPMIAGGQAQSVKVTNYSEIPFSMSKTCHYDMRHNDSKCSECNHNLQEEFK